MWQQYHLRVHPVALILACSLATSCVNKPYLRECFMGGLSQSVELCRGLRIVGGILPRSGSIADSCLGAQNNTQMYGRRPYGVGFLVIGRDVR